ncbi:hypothetical protein ABKV19_021382 [Rosa sericea]
MRNLVFIVCRVLAIVCVVYTILLLCPKCRREHTGRKLRVMLIKIRRVVRKYYYYYSDSKADERWSNGLPQEILLLILQRLCISDYLGEPSMCLLASCCGDGCCYQELPSSYSICASLLKVQTPPPFTLLSVGQVVTFWEGEIVDTKNYTFFTEKWEATQDDDIRHWTKFPSFSALLVLSQADIQAPSHAHPTDFLRLVWPIALSLCLFRFTGVHLRVQQVKDINKLGFMGLVQEELVLIEDCASALNARCATALQTKSVTHQAPTIASLLRERAFCSSVMDQER